MNLTTCLIPAAGEGIRARPYTESVPKAMLKIGGKPLLQHSIELVRNQLNIRHIVIVIGHLGDQIRSYFKDGKSLNVNIEYIENKHIDRGMTWSIYLGKRYTKNNILVLLGDELYINSNHSKLLRLSLQDNIAICGLIRPERHADIQQNYTLEFQQGKVTRIHEKPPMGTEEIMGTGSFVLSNHIFPHIEEQLKTNTCIDFITLLDHLCCSGQKIGTFMLVGNYVNINTTKALERADGLWRKSVEIKLKLS